MRTPVHSDLLHGLSSQLRPFKAIGKYVVVWLLHEVAVPKTVVPAKTSQPRQIGSGVGSLAAKNSLSASADVPASPEEGAALIRAFLQIEQRDVRKAIIDLVTRLSSVRSRDGQP